MCHDPHTLADGTVVACRKCELCTYNRVKDWAGRNIAQSKVSTASFACTLTYGPELDQYPDGHSGQYGNPMPGRKDHLRTAVLTYSDVQKFLKYLRDGLGFKGRDGFEYFVTGELGSQKGRTHWHIILHFRGRVPSHEIALNFSDRHANERGQLFRHDVCKAWPHGFMYWIPARFEDVFYNCKYILKDEGDEASQRKPGMSKKPPIGVEYFRQWADWHVECHLAPQTLFYTFDEIKKDDGRFLQFRLSGRTAEMFVERFIERWKQVHGDKPRPKSDLVDLFEKYGKIVTDEARMLVREEFPDGESRERIPTGKELKAMAADARKEIAVWQQQRAVEDADDNMNRWIKDAENGQERQRREEQFEWEREVKHQEFRDFLHYKGFDTGPAADGGLCDQPGSSGDKSFAEWKRQRDAERSAELERSRQQPEPLGPVGRWNKHYTSEDA